MLKNRKVQAILWLLISIACVAIPAVAFNFPAQVSVKGVALYRSYETLKDAAFLATIFFSVASLLFSIRAITED